MINPKITKLGFRDSVFFQALFLAGLREPGSMFAGSYAEFKNKPLKYFQTKLKLGQYFGLWLDDQLIGIVGVQRSTSPKTKHKVLLKELYIDKKMRRHGLAKILLEKIFVFLKKEKIEQVRLAVRNDNLPAKKLYRNLGFRSYGSAPQALKVGKKYYDDDLLIKFL